MNAMIALIVAIATSQALASSFDNIGNTPNTNTDVRNIIIKTKSDLNVQSLGYNKAMMTQSPLIKKMGLHLLQLSPMLDVNKVLAEVRKHPQVIYAQLDHKVVSRSNGEPNDEDFADQWSMRLEPGNFGIDAINAWMTFGVGGKDVYNNDIVVAVVDGGVDVEHPDLMDNIWFNMAEIDGNGIDDDGNGYIDDITGWNAYYNSGEQQGSRHGTHVAGIVGARGNNNTQVTGVNWDVKLMNIPGSSGNTSVVLRAYQYVLDQKLLWLQTGGREGANIVATNSSFGIDFADCNSGDYPAWNDIYNAMGEAGILSAAATMNMDANVDQDGDVPTGCSSPYIVAVTNSTFKGKRSNSAAYGKTAIDLAAPGTNILSTVQWGGISELTGTSMATPHVAGAVAFLNSVASNTLADMYVNDPGAAALEVKRILLETVTQRENLVEETVSGGILNLYKAAEQAAIYGMGL